MGKAGLKERLRRGESTIGVFMSSTSGTLVEIMGLAGLDFVIIDTEHGPISIETAEDLIRAADTAEIAPIIRVTENEPKLILRALDIGAHGVQVPEVSSRVKAEDAVRAAKYAPLGDRGLSPFVRAHGYLPEGGERYTDKANEETMVIVHIEGVEGVRNLDEILTVQGLDVIFLGPYDLSQSLGIPGQVDHPRVEEKMREVAEKVKRSSMALGAFAKDVPTARRLMTLGVTYMACGVDLAIYFKAFKDIVNGLRA